MNVVLLKNQLYNYFLFQHYYSWEAELSCPIMSEITNLYLCYQCKLSLMDFNRNTSILSLWKVAFVKNRSSTCAPNRDKVLKVKAYTISNVFRLHLKNLFNGKTYWALFGLATTTCKGNIRTFFFWKNSHALQEVDIGGKFSPVLLCTFQLTQYLGCTLHPMCSSEIESNLLFPAAN